MIYETKTLKNIEGRLRKKLNKDDYQEVEDVCGWERKKGIMRYQY